MLFDGTLKLNMRDLIQFKTDVTLFLVYNLRSYQHGAKEN